MSIKKRFWALEFSGKEGERPAQRASHPLFRRCSLGWVACVVGCLAQLLCLPQMLGWSGSALASSLPAGARLVDVVTVVPRIRLDIRYATTNNFLKKAVYPRARCLLRAAVADSLAKVQVDLEKQGLGLQVFDCYRPLSVQKQMWAILPDSRYVANPSVGSKHNRGAAVDVTLVDKLGKPLEMPTGFDDFSERAALDYPGGTATARANRDRLRQVMQRHGFMPIATEWWHFDGPGWEGFGLLDVEFGAVPLPPSNNPVRK